MAQPPPHPPHPRKDTSALGSLCLLQAQHYVSHSMTRGYSDTQHVPTLPHVTWRRV